MNLVIRALTLNEQPLTQAIAGCFDERGGTIGRSDSNTMALPDPERHISRLQAEVIAQGDRYLIRNVGSANPILVNGRAFGPGESALLTHADQVQIGGYVLGVVLDEQVDDARTVVPARAANVRTVIAASARERRTRPPNQMSSPASLPATRAPASSVAGVSAGNPFADLLGQTAPGGRANDAADDPFALLSAGTSSAAPDAEDAPARLPDDFDPFAEITATRPSVKAASPSNSAAPADLLASVGASAGGDTTLDSAFGLEPGAHAGARDPLEAFMRKPPASGPAAGIDLGRDVSTDPFAMFASPQSPSPNPQDRPAAFNHTPELAAAFTPPRVREAPPPVAKAPPTAALDAPAAAPPTLPDDLFADLGLETLPPGDPLAGFVKPPAAPPPLAAQAAVRTPPLRPAPPAQAAVAVRPAERASASGAADPLWAAFCEGAGVRVDLPQGLNPDQMRIVGRLLREAVDGTLKLVAIRATAKQELRAQVTMIRSRNNNPLKFSPDGQLATEQLLQPPLRGFMSGPVAMRDAMHDLVGHSIGTMAGMHAALAGVLQRFEPQQLEAKLTSKSVVDSVLPMNRKAKLWDLYLQHFDAIRNDVQEDFHTLFGKAFVAAYEAELDRLPPAKEA